MCIRDSQYYDQQGLLSPSAKGPQNQRLYTDDNVKDLYRILTSVSYTHLILWTCGFHYRGVICKWLSIVYNNPT